MPVYQRGDVYWIDFRAYGKRYRVPVGTNAKEAQKALDRIKGRVATGEWKPEELNPAPPPPTEPGVSFARAVELYLEHRTAQGKADRSYEMLSRYWLPLFRDRMLRSLTSEEIEAALSTWREERGWSPSTRNQGLAVLSGLLSWCYGRRWIDAHPTEKGRVPMLAVDNARTRWLRPHEIEALVSAAAVVAEERTEAGEWRLPFEPTRRWAAEAFPTIIRFACASGMRFSEICDLRKASYQEDANGKAFLVTGSTKNGTVLHWPLEGPALDMAKAAKDAAPFPGSFLFPGPMGKSATVPIKRLLPMVCKAAGLVYGREDPEGITFHSFRHSMASLALNAGVPEPVVQRMGNWKSRVMVARYAHLSDQTLRDAAAKVAAIVGGGHTVVTVPRLEAGKAQ